MLTVVLGVFGGIIYDIFRVTRKTFNHKDFFIMIEDMLYWLCILFIMFRFMLSRNSGEIRFFAIIGLFIGMILYFLTISSLFIKASMTLVNIISKAFKILMIPIYSICNTVKLVMGFLKRILKKIMKLLKKILQKFKVYARIKALKKLASIFKKA